MFFFFFFFVDRTHQICLSNQKTSFGRPTLCYQKKKADRHYSPSQPQLNKYVQNLLKNIRYGLSIFGQSSWKH